MLFGAHVSTAGGIYKAVDHAEAIGANCLQVFTQSPRAWKLTSHTPEDMERFRERAAEAGIKSSVCHASFLINLGATDDTTYARSVETLRATTDVAEGIGAEGVIFHVGSHLGRGLDAAMHQIVPGIELSLNQRGPDGPWILLENSAGHQQTIGVTIPELAQVIDELGRPERVGICLDTCHLYASGIDITTEEGVESLLADIDGRIGLDRLRCLHVNDSMMPFDSHRDRHAALGKGEIGTKMALILGHPAVRGLPAVLETPGIKGKGPDLPEMKVLRRYHKQGVKRWSAVASR
jgi:deoxyribonuclease-4